MSTCGNCCWFLTPLVYGRDTKISCKTLGELETNEACQRYQRLGIEQAQVPTTSDLLANTKARTIQQKVENGLRKEITASTKDTIISIISDSFELERDTANAVLSWKVALQQQGVDIELDDHLVNRYSKHMTELYILHRIIHAFGMGHLYDQIIQLEIANRFGRSPIVPSTVKTRVIE
jgi:hypothetical protein